MNSLDAVQAAHRCELTAAGVIELGAAHPKFTQAHQVRQVGKLAGRHLQTKVLRGFHGRVSLQIQASIRRPQIANLAGAKTQASQLRQLPEE